MRSNIIGLFLLLLSGPSFAANCGLVSGTFKTQGEECRYSHYRDQYFNDGHREIVINFDEQSKELTISINSNRGGAYTLNYIADNQPRVGGKYNEGNYRAHCENNYIRVHSEYPGVATPQVHHYQITPDGNLHQLVESLVGSFVKDCNLGRISN